MNLQLDCYYLLDASSFYYQWISHNWSVQKISLSLSIKSFHLLSHSLFICSIITQTLPIRLSFQIWPLGMLALYTILHTGSPNWIEKSVELVTGNIVLILQLLGHISLSVVQMTEKYNWLFTTLTAPAPLSWKNIHMSYCRECKNKSELSCWSTEVPL